MRTAIIRGKDLDQETVCDTLALFFSSDFLGFEDISPVRLNDADVIIVNLCKAGDGDLHRLRARRAALEAFPRIAIVTRGHRTELQQAEALGFAHIHFADDPVGTLVKRVRDLGAPRPLYALPDGVSRPMAAAYEKTSAVLEEMHLASVTDGPIPVDRSKDAARDLLNVLERDGVHAWLKAVKTHHSPTFGHSLEVAGLAGWFANELGWTRSECLQVTAGGLLHDIGKSRIPLAVLDKPAVLNEAERDLVRKHAEFGYQIIKHRTEVDNETKEIVFFHHELLDGSGYPFGLSADRISLKVRLVTICDLYSALTEERAYKETLTPRQAIAVMNKMDRKIDQDLYRTFRSLILPREGFGRVQRA
jgi:putative nucleotidyltransferase with HDIG domain